MLRLIFLGVYFYAGLVQAETFRAAPDTAHWKTTSARLKCALSHEIPQFGRATFLHEAGLEPQLILDMVDSAFGGGTAVLVSAPPHWQKMDEEKVLAENALPSGVPIVFAGEIVRTIWSELQRSRDIEFRLPKAYPQAPEPVVAVLSQAGFKAGWEQFQECQQQLVPISFANLAKSQLYFESNTMRLTAESLALLEYMLVYDEEAGPIRKIIIEGHTDSVGRFVENTKLSYQRAWVVKDWLVGYGIPPDVIQVKGLGGSQPIANNKTAEGRAKNRRVTLKLQR